MIKIEVVSPLNPLTEIELPINIDPMKIYEINATVMFDENFLNEIKKNPKLLAKFAGVPEEIIENIDIKIPSQPSAEFRKLMLDITKKVSKEGIVGQEKFENTIADAENFMDLIVFVSASAIAVANVSAVVAANATFAIAVSESIFIY